MIPVGLVGGRVDWGDQPHTLTTLTRWRAYALRRRGRPSGVGGLGWTGRGCLYGPRSPQGSPGVLVPGPFSTRATSDDDGVGWGRLHGPRSRKVHPECWSKFHFGISWPVHSASFRFEACHPPLGIHSSWSVPLPTRSAGQNFDRNNSGLSLG